MNIDTKNLKKVHQTVKGTAFDFADEFDDEFGVDQPKEPEVSLKDLREQSKRTQNVPIYMKGKAEVKADEFDDEDDVFDSIVDKKPPKKKPSVASKRSARAAAPPPPPVRGRGRGGRGRPPKKGKN